MIMLTRCPRCFCEFEPAKAIRPKKPERPQNPYEYTGIFKPYVPMILAGYHRNLAKSTITILVTRAMERDGFHNPHWRDIGATIAYIGRRYGYGNSQTADEIKQLKNARNEHAWFLRLEGKTLQEIGDRLGVSRERARQLIIRFENQIRRATRHTKWHIEYEATQ